VLLLDTFCGAGGAAVGYHRAGWTVIGVDHRPQPRYPFEFHLADAFTFLQDHGTEFDLIHASPPCQAYSSTRYLNPHVTYPDLIEPLRELLHQVGRPYVIENVVGAPLIRPVLLCGLTFGLKLFRHRLFECSPWILGPPHIPHGTRRIGKDGYTCVAGGGDTARDTVTPDHRSKAAWQQSMGIDWMTTRELKQAIPPAYTQWIGEQMIHAIRNLHTEPYHA
jgi:DNA (cytosine-5)-methyltransferase 1